MLRLAVCCALLTAIFGQSQSWCQPASYQAELATAYGKASNEEGVFVDSTYAYDVSGGRTRSYFAQNEVPGFRPVTIFISDSKANMSWTVHADSSGKPLRCTSASGTSKVAHCFNETAGWKGWYTQNVGGWNGKGGAKVQLLTLKRTDGSYAQEWVSKDASGAVIPVNFHYLDSSAKSLSVIEYSSATMANETLFTPPSICNTEYTEGMPALREEDVPLVHRLINGVLN